MARQTSIEHVNQFITDGDGRIAMIRGVPAATTGTVGATIGDTVVASTYGMTSVSVNFLGSNAPTVTFEHSFDGGTTWLAVQLFAAATLTLTTTPLVFAGVFWEGGLPAGCTHFRVRSTIASATGLTCLISPSPSPYRSSQTVNIVTGSSVALNPGSARVGTVGAQAQSFFTDESTTPLAGTGTATGASYDLAQVASPGTITSTSAAMKEFRALAAADVTGTLHVEVSTNQTTWWRISSTATVAVGTIFYAQAQVLPVTRYARAVYVNGAGAQAAFLLSTSRFD